MGHLGEAAATTNELSGIFREKLAGAVPAGGRVALVNFPNIGNPGDAAIYAGTRAALEQQRVRIAYACEPRGYRRALLRRAIGPKGTILIQGGGNFGDLYRRNGQQRVRMRVLHDFPDAQVVQLPQTVYFERPKAANRVGRVLREHQNLTIMVRDTASAERLRELGIATTVLCPDAAFALGPVARPCRPSRPVVWIAREDVESAGRRPDRDAQPHDWPTADEQRGGRRGLGIKADWTLTRTVARHVGRLSAGNEAVARLAARRFLPLATRRVELALRTIAAGRVLVTDRLHAHILACLLGMPNVLLDNAYGKNQAVYNTWTHRYEIAHYAADPASAWALATELAES